MSVDIPNLLSKAGNLTTEILGYIRIQVLEAKDIAVMDFGGKTDPFAKIYYSGIQNHKQKLNTAVREKTLNPSWTEIFHSWILDTSALRVEVWDWDRLSPNEFAGRVSIPIVLQDGYVEDKWHNLQARENNEKKDKHVKGQVRVRYEIHLIKRNDAFIWKRPTYVLIDPKVFPNPQIEIQGDVDDDLMMIFCSGTVLPLPNKIYDRNGNPQCWTIKVPEKLGWWSEGMRLEDRIQNLMLTIWNRWKNLGWFYVGKKGNDALLLNHPSSAPWYMPPPSPYPAPVHLGYIMIEQRPYQATLEVQGAIDPQLMMEMIKGLQVKRIDDKDGSPLKWVVTMPISMHDAKTNELRFFSNLVKSLNLLGREGYTYVTDYRFSFYGEHPQHQQPVHHFVDTCHFLYRDVNTLYYAKTVYPPDYILVDSRPAAFKVAILGDLDVQIFLQMDNFPKPQEIKDKDTGVHLAWEWEAPGKSTCFTQSEARRLENRYQNFMLRLYDGLSKLGYTYINDLNQANLFSRTGQPVMHSTHLMVDLSIIDGRPAIEFQGEIDGSLLNEMASYAGLTPAKDVKDTSNHKQHLAWAMDIPVGTVAWTQSEAKRMINRYQNFMLKVLDLLNKVGYDYITAQGKTHLLVKKQSVPNYPLTWLLLDPPNIMLGTPIEIQGQISKEYISNLALRIKGPNPEPVYDKDSAKTLLCYSIPVKLSAYSSQYENTVQNLILRILDVLYEYGWIVIERADTSSGIFLIRYGHQ